MVLLTSSSISVLVTSTVIFLFTFILFLSGYILQQQTVRSLQAALHPPEEKPLKVQILPTYPKGYTADGRKKSATELGREEAEEELRRIRGHELTVMVKDGGAAAENRNEGEQQQQQQQEQEHTVAKVATEFGSPPGSEGYKAYRDGLAVAGGMMSEQVSMREGGEGDASMTPLSPDDKEAERLAEKERLKDLAYVQMVMDPRDVCGSIYFFGSLEKQGSKVPNRVVLYPGSWEMRRRDLSSSPSTKKSSEQEEPEDDSSSESMSTPSSSQIQETNALAALEEAQDALNLTLRPVQIHTDDKDDGSSSLPIATTMLTSAFLLPHYDRVMFVRRGGYLDSAHRLDMMLAASKVQKLENGVAVVGGTAEERNEISLLLVRPDEDVWAKATSAGATRIETSESSWDEKEAVRSLVKESGLDVPWLEVLVDGDGNVVLHRQDKESTDEKKVDGSAATVAEKTTYLQFEREELDGGEVRDTKGGLWWDGLVRYKRGIREACKGMNGLG